LVELDHGPTASCKRQIAITKLQSGAAAPALNEISYSGEYG
jgi:hypothetical protein